MSHQTKFHEKVENQIASLIEKKLGIKIEYEVFPDGNWEQVFRTKMAAGDSPDLVVMNAPTSYGQYDAGSFVDLSKEAWVSKLVNPKALLDPTGKIFAQPRFSTGFHTTISYNKKIFKDLKLNENPTTYAEFLADLEKVKNDGTYTPLIMSNKAKWSTRIFMLYGIAAAVYGGAARTPRPSTRSGTIPRAVSHASHPGQIPMWRHP